MTNITCLFSHNYYSSLRTFKPSQTSPSSFKRLCKSSFLWYTRCFWFTKVKLFLCYACVSFRMSARRPWQSSAVKETVNSCSKLNNALTFFTQTKAAMQETDSTNIHGTLHPVQQQKLLTIHKHTRTSCFPSLFLFFMSSILFLSVYMMQSHFFPGFLSLFLSLSVSILQ